MKQTLQEISKRGDTYRILLIHGARLAVLGSTAQSEGAAGLHNLLQWRCPTSLHWPRRTRMLELPGHYLLMTEVSSLIHTHSCGCIIGTVGVNKRNNQVIHFTECLVEHEMMAK